MSLIVVDPEKCNRDGICVEICPGKILQLKDSDEIPTPVDGADEFCINCGHCVSVCPTGALSLETMPSEDCIPIQKELTLNLEQVTQFLRSRRSIRVYTDKLVDRDIISQLIKLASFAPTGSNTQPVEWRVIYDTSEVRRLAGMVVDWMRHVIKEQPDLASAMNLERVVAAWESGEERICRGAPHVIVSHAPKDLRTSMGSCIIAQTYLELAAPAFGLGACWGGYFNAASNMWPPMTEALDLPEGNASFGAMMVGYSKYKYQRLPLRNEPKISWK